MNSKKHKKHCFVVMPSGRSEEESEWFNSWYNSVLKPAIELTEFKPILALETQEPTAINDEIRAHLAYDAMVVVDLGGRYSQSEPNPNVMYELGIRHAMNKPVVLVGWEKQVFPFDISNQRTVCINRQTHNLTESRRIIFNFIKAAKAGIYYRPMDAVGRAVEIRPKEISNVNKLLNNIIKLLKFLGEIFVNIGRGFFI